MDIRELGEGISRDAKVRSARAAMVGWMLGVSVLVCVLAIANLHRRPIDYSHDDGARDALRSSAINDTRYLAVDGESSTVPLPPNQSFPREEPLTPGRDVRLVPQAPADQHYKQHDYMTRYNGMMMELLRVGQQQGHTIKRAEPLSGTLFVLTSMLVAVPFYLHLYLLYLLGPYRLDGRLWPIRFWSEDSWEYMRPSRYADGAQLLLMLLWINTGLLVPWVLMVGLAVSHRPLP